MTLLDPKLPSAADTVLVDPALLDGACQQRGKAAFADTLDRLSQLSWSELRLSPRHGLGYEQIPRHALRASLPSHLTEDVQRLIAFRFAGNAPMVGYRVQAIFYILWLDRDFTLYDHG
jgi:hypothetical protein